MGVFKKYFLLSFCIFHEIVLNQILDPFPLLCLNILPPPNLMHSIMNVKSCPVNHLYSDVPLCKFIQWNLVNLSRVLKGDLLSLTEQ